MLKFVKCTGGKVFFIHSLFICFLRQMSFNLPKLDVKFVHWEHDIVVENNIMGIQLKSIKSRSTEDVGESTRLDVQLDFSEIHV